MKNLIRFLWMKERFNHLWTFLVIWLIGTLWVIVMSDGMFHLFTLPWFILDVILVLILVSRLSEVCNVFNVKHNILVPANMSQKYLSLLLFQMPLTVATVVLGYALALGCGNVLLHCLGGNTIDLTQAWDFLVLDPIALVAMLLGCMWLLTLSIGYGAMSISIFVLLAFVYMKIFSFAYGHGMEIQTMTMILLVNAIILLPVSWLMFIRKKYDKFVCFSQNVNG